MVNDKQFLLRLPEEMRSAVAEAAQNSGCTQSQWIRLAIQAQLDGPEEYDGQSAEMPGTPEAARRIKNAWWL